MLKLFEINSAACCSVLHTESLHILMLIARCVPFLFLKLQMPPLCDDILLDIFANLNVQQLFTVSQCSRRFMALAQKVFSTTMDGRLALSQLKFDSRTLPPPSVQVMDLLRIFGAYIKRLECTCNVQHWPLPWHYLCIDQLLSLRIDISQLADLDFDRTRFAQRNLQTLVAYDRVGVTAINGCLPRELIYLKVCDADAFRVNRLRELLRQNATLHHLVMPATSISLNDLIELMFTVGMHLTLKTLIVPDGYQRYVPVNEKLLAFGVLKSLVLHTDESFCTIHNASLINRMRTVKNLEINMRGLVSAEWQLDFVNTLATDVSPQLKWFKFAGFYHGPSAERTLRKAMPKNCECIVEGISASAQTEE